MSIINSFIKDIFEKLAVKSAKLARYTKKPTIMSEEIHSSSEMGKSVLRVVDTGYDMRKTVNVELFG
jgi:hypothetical protein